MSDTAWLDDAPEAKWLDDAPDAPQSPQVQMASSHRMETAPSHHANPTKWEPGTSPAPSARASVIGEEPGGFGRGVARGGWAVPGLVGLDYETATAFESALRDPNKLQADGIGFLDRVKWYREQERERTRRGEQENPVKTGLGIGAGSAPSALLLPQAKAAEGAGLGARALASATTAGAQSAAIEGGVTGDLPVGPRLARMGVAGVTGAGLSALAPVPSHIPTQDAIDATAGVKVPEPLVDYLRRKGGERNIKAAGGIQSDIARARKQMGPGGVNNGRAELTELGAEMGERKLVGPTTTPATTFERAASLMDDAGERMGAILKAADESGSGRPSWQRVISEGRKVLADLRKDPNNAAAADRFEELLSGYAEKAGIKGLDARSPVPTVRQSVPGPPVTREVRTESPGGTITPSPNVEYETRLVRKVHPLPPGSRPDLAPSVSLETVRVPRVATGKTSQLDPAVIYGTETSAGPSTTVMQARPGAAGYSSVSYEKPLSFTELHGVRKQIDRSLYGLRGNKDPWSDAYKGALHDFRSAVSDEIDSSLDSATASSPAWREANRDYQVGATALKFADKGMDRAHGNNMVSPVELLSGLAGVAAGGTHGSATAGLAGLGMAAGTMLARRHGSGTLGKISVSLSNALKANPAQFGPYAQPLLAAAERGPEALAAAHYLLSNSSVEYRARWASASAGDEGNQ